MKSFSVFGYDGQFGYVHHIGCDGQFACASNAIEDDF